jgi:hypothetical protein
MSGFGQRLKYLFTSTNGLVLTAIAITGLLAALMSTLSGPMAEWGVREITIKVLGMKLVEAEREGRVVLLYHSFFMPVVAILVYFITANVRIKENWDSFINSTVTVGYITAVCSGIGFAYFGHSPALHGLMLVGLSLVFFAGVMLAGALWPWNKEYYLSPDSPYAHTRRGVDLERVAFWVVTVATLGSAALGAWAGAYYGSGFETVLAEDIVRQPIKTTLELAVVGHLHIMLSLIGITAILLLGRWFDFHGFWHRLAMPLLIIGSITMTIGCWGVVSFQSIAHIIIYTGSLFALAGALFLVIFGIPALVRDYLNQWKIKNATAGQKIKALLYDPLKFGALWQIIFMNFTTTFVGIFMAIKLDKIFRAWPLREERIELAGHWHILASIIAIALLLYFVDQLNLKGLPRRLFGWTVIIGADLAFAAITVFAMKRLFVSEYMQQPVVNLTMLLSEIGLGVTMVSLALLLVWRLVDLFKADGLWKQELQEADTSSFTGKPASM